MTKSEIVDSLRRYALLTELLGEDPFRARAFDAAARALEHWPESIDELISEGRLGSVKGVGKTVASAVRELHAAGGFADFERVSRAVPDGVLDLLKIEGLGPKKARALWTELKVQSLDGLESSIKSGTVLSLSGFGAKTIEKFLSSIAFVRANAGRHLRHHARRAASEVNRSLSMIQGVQEVYFGGSLARGLETIGDLDCIAIADRSVRAEIERQVAGLSMITWRSKGEPFWCGRVGEFEIEFSVVAPEHAAARKLVLTGSSTFYAALVRHAEAKGFRLTLDELVDRTGRRVECASERELFDALQLEFVPPALRESETTIVSKGKGYWPSPVSRGDFRGIVHNHSTWSDGHCTIRDMAMAVRSRGSQYVGIADHSKAAAYANGLTSERVRQQWREIDLLNAELAPFRILKGTECDILADGRLDFDDDLLSQFDFVVASIHSGFGMTEAEATDRLCRALENPHVDILGHPTGRLLTERPGYPVNHERLIETAARNGKAIELNANPHRLDIDWRWIPLCIEAGVPIPIQPDAHAFEGLDDIEYGIDVASKASLEAKHCPSTWTADEFLDWCKTHK